ncbi:MAG: response regulator, partial [Candidatus Omnitrophica bacterium]|nr:response regulator [Candidatus Omnitrophota bacterium]
MPIESRGSLLWKSGKDPVSLISCFANSRKLMTTLPIHTVLLVDDNPDDCEIVKEAWEEIPIGQELRCVNDGTELLDYLYGRGVFSRRECAPRPSVILLDLNMPHMTGEEVLIEIKKDPLLASIPIVVLTTSKAP